MANPNAIVATVTRITQPIKGRAAEFMVATPEGIQVEFADGRTARLDTTDKVRTPVHAEIFDELRRMVEPVYVEIDPATSIVTRLLIPLVVRVTGITPTDSGDLDVELKISHGRHILKRTNSDYDDLATKLQSARDQGIFVAVTETEIDHEIIDVRPTPNPVAPAVPEEAPAPPAELVGGLRNVTPERARELFCLVSAQTCAPILSLPKCIPFLYPDDGCWGRAHKMCELMIAAGEQPGKVWIYGQLKVNTRNHPNCEVPWGWHVAPILQVTLGDATQLQVIDPSSTLR